MNFYDEEITINPDSKQPLSSIKIDRLPSGGGRAAGYSGAARLTGSGRNPANPNDLAAVSDAGRRIKKQENRMVC